MSYPGVRAGLDRLIEGGLKRLRPDAQPVMVASHERSGTHFMMNTLAACFGYASRPWIDIDYSTFNINYFDRETMRVLLAAIARLRTASIAKSHHSAAFFDGALDGVSGLEIVYVCRRPADVMASFWRFNQSWRWLEGPREETLLGFAKAQPMGQSMRYQHRQCVDMLDRWASHVRGWLEAAERSEHIHVLRYEDLAADFAGAVARLAEALKLAPIRLLRPSPHDNVVAPGPVRFAGAEESHERGMVTLLALQRYPELMQRLGYGEASQLQAG